MLLLFNVKRGGDADGLQPSTVILTTITALIQSICLSYIRKRSQASSGLFGAYRRNDGVTLLTESGDYVSLATSQTTSTYTGTTYPIRILFLARNIPQKGSVDVLTLHHAPEIGGRAIHRDLNPDLLPKANNYAHSENGHRCSFTRPFVRLPGVAHTGRFVRRWAHRRTQHSDARSLHPRASRGCPCARPWRVTARRLR